MMIESEEEARVRIATGAIYTSIVASSILFVSLFVYEFPPEFVLPITWTFAALVAVGTRACAWRRHNSS